jgi:peptidyl-prolyl cis-trans isomerase C
LESVAVQKLVQEKVEKDIRVSSEESKKYYEDHRDTFTEPEQVRASHILAKVDSGADEKKKTEARMKIKKIRDRIKNGEDFATLAKALSEGPSSVNGGDLGFFARGQMVPPFEEAAFALQPDQLSDIVETRFGYHLIRVTDRKAERKFTYEQVQDDVKNQVVQLKMKEAMNRYIKGLRETAKIQK